MRLHSLRLRSDLLGAIREYFLGEGLLEVTTPTLGPYGVSDPNLDNLRLSEGLAPGTPNHPRNDYLQTSPEYAMKRLVSRYKESIFQICPAYRGGESGKQHRPEFLMLEWYRCGFDLPMLMDDVTRLLHFCVAKLEHHRLAGENLSSYLRESEQNSATCPERIEYQKLFQDAFDVNPHPASLEALQRLATRHKLQHLSGKDSHAEKQDYLDGLFALVLEPSIKAPTLVYDFPACQAALAKLRKNDRGETVSSRFELYVLGMEVANAYDELNDEAQLRARFANNNRIRRNRSLPIVPDDEDLLQSTHHLPDCAGIALGIDRLLMAIIGTDSIAAVQSL